MVFAQHPDMVGPTGVPVIPLFRKYKKCGLSPSPLFAALGMQNPFQKIKRQVLPGKQDRKPDSAHGFLLTARMVAAECAGEQHGKTIPLIKRYNSHSPLPLV